MSAAISATTARERARIAAAFIQRGSKQNRGFCNCFEMGDGDEVIRLLVERARKNPEFAVKLRRYIVTPDLDALLAERAS